MLTREMLSPIFFKYNERNFLICDLFVNFVNLYANYSVYKTISKEEFLSSKEDLLLFTSVFIGVDDEKSLMVWFEAFFCNLFSKENIDKHTLFGKTNTSDFNINMTLRKLSGMTYENFCLIGHLVNLWKYSEFNIEKSSILYSALCICGKTNSEEYSVSDSCKGVMKLCASIF